MKITKFGHCCLLIEVQGKRILTDPGAFTTAQNEVRDIDIILITHEHGDHLHTESLAKILENNPSAKVVTNSSVGKILSDIGVDYEILEGDSKSLVSDVSVEAYDGKHAEIYEEYGQVQNTGYFIADKLFYPGDSYIEPGKPVHVLALPVSGPWCKSAEALAYALRIKPQIAFPVHDGLLNEFGISVVHGFFEKLLPKSNIDFVRLTNGESKEFDI